MIKDDKFWAELTALLNPPSRPDGDDWFTCEEYMEKTGLKKTAAYRRLSKGVKTGVLQVVERTSKQSNRAYYYRMVNLIAYN